MTSHSISYMMSYLVVGVSLGTLLASAATSTKEEIQDLVFNGRKLQSTSVPASENPSANANSAYYQFNLFLAHGVLMAIAFGVILPIGALFPALTFFRNERSGNRWFQLHAIFQTSGFLIAVMALLIVMFNIAMIYGNLSRVVNRSPHGPLGIALMVIVFVQFTSGACRPHAPANNTEQKSMKRVAFEAVHPQLGHIIIVLAAVQLWYGYASLINYISSAYQRNAVMVWAYVQAISMPVIFFTLVLHSKFRTGKASLGFSRNANTNPMMPPVMDVQNTKPANAVSTVDQSHNPVPETRSAYTPGAIKTATSSNNQPQMAIV